MSNALVVSEPRSILNTMSERYGMEPGAFEATVRATCMKPQKGREATPEEFGAFLLVAKEYGLNPLTKEIYAFPAQNGGIVPVVSIDGWVNLIQSHPQCDGFDFTYEHDDKGNLISCECTMYRKDRSRPTVVKEFLFECIRNTDPWKMKHRMLRHKTLIQAGRYAFGFSGIYDDDEALKIAEMRDVTPSSPPSPPEELQRTDRQEASPSAGGETGQKSSQPPVPPTQKGSGQKASTPPTPPAQQKREQTIDSDPFDKVFAKFDHDLAKAENMDELKVAWNSGRPAKDQVSEEQEGRLTKLKAKHKKRIAERLQAAAEAGEQQDDGGQDDGAPADDGGEPWDAQAFLADIHGRLKSAGTEQEVDDILAEVDQAVELGKISENEKEEHFTDAISDAYERMG